ncbi:MAG: hypothetical protein ACRD3J_30080 [Thermoanaerobaculia bacterium]
MKLVAHKYAEIVFEQTPVLANSRKTIAPIQMPDADCRKTELIFVKRLINIENPHGHNRNASTAGVFDSCRSSGLAARVIGG